MFQNLEIFNWKQFNQLNLSFHPRLTVLTGANGAGKTTILKILAQHFGWPNQELSTPFKEEKSGIFQYFVRFFKKPSTEDEKIGKITYSDGKEAILKLPQKNNSPTYNINIESKSSVKGFYIPSHRPVFAYKKVPHLSTLKRGKSQAYSTFQNSYRSRATGSGGDSSSYFIKDMLINWAVHGYGNKIIEADEEQKKLYLGFQEILKKVLPKKLGFQEFKIRDYEIVLITNTGDFILDAVSGGISSIIDLAWQIYMYPDESSGFVVIIDEVENHLHAEMQREILPNLLDAFPSVQFIVSTHSPLIVGSSEDSRTYALKYNDENKIEDIELDLSANSGDSNKILRDVLGVPVSMPLWIEKKLSKIFKDFQQQELTSNSLTSLRNNLKEYGFENLVPEIIVNKVNKIKDDQNQ